MPSPTIPPLIQLNKISTSSKGILYGISGLVSYEGGTPDARELVQSNRSILGILQYGVVPSRKEIGLQPCPHIFMPQIGSDHIVEIWSSPGSVHYDQKGMIRAASDGNVLFGSYEEAVTEGEPLELVSERSYREILAYCHQAGYDHLFRLWNYFPRINEEQGGLERYKRFCVGRYQAFSSQYQNLQQVVPSASAVGTNSGSFLVIFLAGKIPGRHIENPSQMSAYHYPRVYGPKSPSFSRATIGQISPEESSLFVAGTASILGHQTQHVNDPENQTKETLANIQRVINQAVSVAGVRRKRRDFSGLLKVYVRHEAHVSLVQKSIGKSWAADMPTIFLLGELCRKELLVEIEGVWAFPPNPAVGSNLE